MNVEGIQNGAFRRPVEEEGGLEGEILR